MRREQLNGARWCRFFDLICIWSYLFHKMFGGFGGWSSRSTGMNNTGTCTNNAGHDDDDSNSSSSSSSNDGAFIPASAAVSALAPASALAPQTPPRSSASSAIGHHYSQGHGPSHSRDSSLDEASMSDLTSTSYQQPQPRPHIPQTNNGNSNNSPAVSELTESSACLVQGLSSSSLPALPSIDLGLGRNLQAIRRPARIASRLESIPSVGYVNSHEEPEPESVDNDHHDGSDGSGSSSSKFSSSPQHLLHGYGAQDDYSISNNQQSNADKFSHHLQRYNDHVDKKKLCHHHHHHNHQKQLAAQTDVTDTSTVDESYSEESEWSTPHSSHSNLASASVSSASASVSAASASRSSSCDTSSTTRQLLQGLPHVQPHAHAHAQPHPLHTITSFNTSATDGDIDTDGDMDVDMDEDSLLYHHHHHQHHMQGTQGQQDRPLSPVLPAGSMTNRPPSRRSNRALSPPTPRSVTTTTTANTPRARSYQHQHQQHCHQQQQQPNRPPSRAGSISRPRYAVEFRHRPNANATACTEHPSPVATEAAARAQQQQAAVAVYGRDGRDVERVVMDVDDPYLSHGSSADDLDVHTTTCSGMEEGNCSSRHHHPNKLRRSDAGLAPLPTPTATVGMDMHGTGLCHGQSGKLMSNLFGTLFRTIRTTLLLGAFGATITLLRAHFLLAAGGSAASIGGVGGAAATIFGSSAALASSQGLAASGGIAAVRLASGALALPKVTDLLLTAAIREAARAERAVLREKVQRMARMLPDGRPVSVPGNGIAAATAQQGQGRRLSTRDGTASANGETYAVRLTTTPGRSDLTDAAVERLAQCPSIADVRLDHSSDSKDDHDLLGGWGDEGSIIKRPGLTTDAVLLLADDLAFTCEELDRGKLQLSTGT